jgi:hypothetical protein
VDVQSPCQIRVKAQNQPFIQQQQQGEMQYTDTVHGMWIQQASIREALLRTGHDAPTPHSKSASSVPLKRQRSSFLSAGDDEAEVALLLGAMSRETGCAPVAADAMQSDVDMWHASSPPSALHSSPSFTHSGSDVTLTALHPSMDLVDSLDSPASCEWHDAPFSWTLHDGSTAAPVNHMSGQSEASAAHVAENANTTPQIYDDLSARRSLFRSPSLVQTEAWLAKQGHSDYPDLNGASFLLDENEDMAMSSVVPDAS